MLFIITVFTLAYIALEGKFDPTSRVKDSVIPAAVSALIAVGVEYYLWDMFRDMGTQIPALLATMMAADVFALVVMFFYFTAVMIHNQVSSR
jgi:anaerobic C4-dicarboxylate transporter